MQKTIFNLEVSYRMNKWIPYFILFVLSLSVVIDLHLIKKIDELIYWLKYRRWKTKFPEAVIYNKADLIRFSTEKEEENYSAVIILLVCRINFPCVYFLELVLKWLKFYFYYFPSGSYLRSALVSSKNFHLRI